MSAGNDALVDWVARHARRYLSPEFRSERVLEAMRRVDRVHFLPPAWKDRAYEDEALPIGMGQTCSQPSMVAFMLDKLDIRPGMRILEVGSGSGYAACIASLLCSPGGEIIACEILPELALACRTNLAVFSAPISVVEADGSAGLPGRGPYDRIMLSAGVKLPGFDEAPFLSSLKPRGVLLYPETRGSLHRAEKTADGRIKRESWRGVAFVPLVKRDMP